MREVWIPTAPDCPNRLVYAAIGGLCTETHEAIQFATERECAKWCDDEWLQVTPSSRYTAPWVPRLYQLEDV